MSNNHPELFFALVGAVGTDLDQVQQSLTTELKKVDYDTQPIKLSGLISDCYKYQSLKEIKEQAEHITKHMDAGDELRKVSERGDTVALLGITKCRELRETITHDAKIPAPKTAYIINSLKHPDEAKTLRAIYGESLFIISVYSPKEERQKRLLQKIFNRHHWGRKGEGEYSPVIDGIIKRDRKAPHDDFGQNVRDTFPLADLFIDEKDSQHQIERFVKLLFGYQFTTPTADEYCMFHARATSLRSADLSRQVGAVISAPDGSIISLGCNEVPTAGGGCVWEGDTKPDNRDFIVGQDASAGWKQENITELFELLKNANWLSSEKMLCSPEDLAKESLSGDIAPLKDSGISNIIEFGRIVHAEMNSICEAARYGRSIAGATLYCTTFPCHMCARHIIASGINRVVYIEPYPKSQAKELYDESIQLDNESTHAEVVKFDSFVGVAPKRYMSLFRMNKRKDVAGFPLEWDGTSAAPKLSFVYPRYVELESGYIETLFKNGAEYGIIPPETTGVSG